MRAAPEEERMGSHSVPSLVALEVAFTLPRPRNSTRVTIRARWIRSFSIFGGILIVLVLLGCTRTVFDNKRPFLRKFDEAEHAYIGLAIAGIAFVALPRIDFSRIVSFKTGPIEASLKAIDEKVKSLSEQVEEFYRSEKVEVFDEKNWARVRVVSKTAEGVVLEVVLEQPPIPGSVRVYEGVLQMPQRGYQVDGNRLRFPANSEQPSNPIAIYYHPRPAAPPVASSTPRP